MSNPVLNERVMKDAPTTWAPPEPTNQHFPPVTDGPITPLSGSPKVMTVNGTISATAVLFVLLLVSATVGWMQTETVEVDGQEFVSGIPALAWVGMIVGVGLTFLLMFKPHLAKFVAPVYAIAEGFFIGAISKAYESWYDGIVVQAIGATVAVFMVMLVLYRTNIIKVTNRFRKIVVTATIGVMLFYGVTFIISLFAGADSISFLSSPSLLGIAFSVFVAGLAAMNLALDFDFIERGAQQGLDKNFEWYAAFGLLVTLIWLYLELLRLLAKLRER
ncbi:putative YccA/Bax inhibitor family protein [Ilumatobacter fluminis]|uniref:Putative YccA/Bax inhibitor family protein n=1 Tax=Ilumatobacter fluminis TaxID=467091 RepID=A0A4R7HYJ4_9ACTN|nr:Bax inhibitor-1/YccA family protein [Ilumatobacter fluminis]TDT15223.1 putative YccA/Bax inhibitor family protein [Ilumatobacter fluminis]